MQESQDTCKAGKIQNEDKIGAKKVTRKITFNDLDVIIPLSNVAFD